MKKINRFLLLFLFPWLLLAQQPAHNKKVVGYYAQWAIYARDFNVPKIDGSKLTHLNYSFYGTEFDAAHPENTKLHCLDTYADFEHTEGGIPWDAPVKGNFYDLKKLKEKYPHLKILISVGGWTKGQDLSPISASPIARNALAADMAKFLVTYPFIDGFDIDWEYPLSGGTDGTEIVNGIPVPPQKYSPDDNKNLVYLLKAMRQAMPNKLISIAAGNNVRKVASQYLGPNNRTQYGMTEDISTYCDYITYFGYDFGGNWYDKTCYNAPLYASGNTNDPLYGAAQSESLDELTNQYLNVVGFPANKLIMGLPFYGKIFKNVANNGTTPNFPGLFVAAPRDAVSGCTNPQNPIGTWDGPAACERSGSIEICDLVGNPVTNSHPYLDATSMTVTSTAAAAGWVRYFDNTTKVPYLYNATLHQFISYEDKQSTDLKVQYIKSKNLAGGMIWELSQDTRGASPNLLLSQVDASFGSVVPGTLTVSGSVKNGTNLVTDVTVQLKDASNVVLQSIVSTTGNYTFSNVVSGANYSVTALKSSYTFTPVALTNITTNQSGIIVQGTQPLYTVSGSVLDGITAVSGVTVTATSGATVVTAVSNASGVYSIAGLTAGLDFTITASKAGQTFSPASTVYTVLSSDKVLNFSQNPPVVYYTISGTVMDGTTAVSGATVSATSTAGTFTATSSASGTYSIANLPSAANYTVTIAKAGQTYTPASTVYTNLNANKVLNFVQDVIIIGTNKISGTVKNGTTPKQGAKVELILPWTDNSHPYQSKIAITDAQGKYSFDNTLLAGYTTVSSLKLNTWENNEVVYLPSNLANFNVPATPQVYDFNSSTVTPTYYTVSGTVMNGTTPVSGVTVSAISGTTTLTATSDTAGAYTVANLVSGSDYTVTAAKTALTFAPASTVFTAIAANKTLHFTQNVVTPTYYTVSGTVMNGTTPVSGVTVSAVSGATTLTAVSDVNGAYTVTNLVSGSNYTVTAAKTGLTFAPASTVYTAIAANKTLNFTQNVVTPTYYTVNGTVMNGTTPVSGVTVSAVSGATTLTAVSDVNGAYTVTNLVSGSNYTVTATKTGLTFAPASTVYTAIAANKTLNLTQNVASGNLVSGTVKSGSTPVAGAKVELIVPWTDNTHGYANFIAISDAQGKFSFSNTILAGYSTISSLKLNAWENNGITYSPTNLANFAVPTTPQVYNFNSNSVAPQVTITSPTLTTVAIAPGTAIQLKADASLTFADASVSISSVVFNINGQNITATLSTGTEYVASWTPATADFNKNYTLKATVTASNSVTAENTRGFYLQCSGTSCPNLLPVIAWVSPAATSINQSSGFQPVVVSVNVTDTDGTVSGVSLSIDGTSFAMTKGTGNAYNYTFTPNAFKTYALVVKATDNVGGITTLNQSIGIISSSFNPLPAKVIVGYAHGWENGSAPFLYFNQMGDKKFNVVVYSFIETVNRDGYTPMLVINEPRFFTNGVFDPQLLKNDIKFLRDKGIPVIVSIGGQNGHVELQTVAQKNIFVNGLKAIVDQYKFDGIDIDFEGGSMNFGAGALKDFSYASISAYPKLKNVVDAFKELKASYGSGFILTAAPETYYVQVGYSVYGDGAGSFLPVIDNLRNELDLLMVQLYNTGSISALDNVAYSQATPDFLVSMSDMMIKGFNVASTGYHFNGLPASKIVIAIPACAPAAPAGGYLTPQKGIQAFNYLRYGTTFAGRTYTMQSAPQPGLRGVMTWSINWDAACGTGYEFSNAYATYFSSQTAKLSVGKIEASRDMVAYFKDNALLVTNDANSIMQVEVYNSIGQSLVSYRNVQNSKDVVLQNNAFFTKQLFVVVVTDNLGNRKSFKLLNFLN
ncbi:glycoside hydrolase [Flavobacterium sp. ZT3R18]|uniref:glycosyl hydrolase family 18 protein n=1 Tax=Flavobacterium sp. ZT3R18 TaxID=2594429 RepID=UPI001179978C|nr:glycosyl hydrolase family 18 protein [Flavobacterium sp. ZT3R18]TRX35195.1 glycoside hydrolase [Flavobacterium sp. ZT3R18]